MLKELGFYASALRRMTVHYLDKEVNGFRSYGSLEEASEEIIEEASKNDFPAGAHFPGTWPRDVFFASKGIVELGYEEELSETMEEIVGEMDENFYTRLGERNIATPEPGVDTFPAIVLTLARLGEIEKHNEKILELEGLFLEKFYNHEKNIVDGEGSSWWDSARHPRKAYNTAMTLAAAKKLEDTGLDSELGRKTDDIGKALREEYWNGGYFDEHEKSSTFAADANFVPLYLGILDEEEAGSIVESSKVLDTRKGKLKREKPFSFSEVRKMFWTHRDYHWHIWPWSNLLFVSGARKYVMKEEAKKELEKIEGAMRKNGNFLEKLDLDGEPYTRIGYAASEDFLAATGLWKEAENRFND